MEQYIVSGNIPVRASCTQELVNEVIDQIATDHGWGDITMELHNNSVQVFISAGCSYSKAEEIDGLLVDFASEHASGLSILETEYGTEGGSKLHLGPSGFHIADSIVADIDKQIANLLQRRAELTASTHETFEHWWYQQGSGPIAVGLDLEEHTKAVSQKAWDAGSRNFRSGHPVRLVVEVSDGGVENIVSDTEMLLQIAVCDSYTEYADEVFCFNGIEATITKHDPVVDADAVNAVFTATLREEE